MNAKAFFDTNIFIYLYAANEPAKQTVSREIVNNADDCITSTQILNEINNVLIKNGECPLNQLKRYKKIYGRLARYYILAKTR